MPFEAHHTIIVRTPETGAFERVEGMVQRDFYSYEHAKLYDQHEIFFDYADETWHVLVEGQKIPRTVALELVRAARGGLVKITKFQDFL